MPLVRMFWPGSQVCTYRQLQLAEALGELAGATDTLEIL